MLIIKKNIMLGNNQRSSNRGRRGRNNSRGRGIGRRSNQGQSRATPPTAGVMASGMVGQRNNLDPTASINNAISSVKPQGPRLFNPQVLRPGANAPQPAGTTGMTFGSPQRMSQPEGPTRTIGRGAGAFGMQGRSSVGSTPAQPRLFDPKVGVNRATGILGNPQGPRPASSPGAVQPRLFNPSQLPSTVNASLINMPVSSSGPFSNPVKTRVGGPGLVIPDRGRGRSRGRDRSRGRSRGRSMGRGKRR